MYCTAVKFSTVFIVRNSNKIFFNPFLSCSVGPILPVSIHPISILVSKIGAMSLNWRVFNLLTLLQNDVVFEW